MRLAAMLLVLGLAGPVLQEGAMAADTKGHITGVGGVFVKSHDPKALAAWYRDVLGIAIQSWGGAKLATDVPLHPPSVAWNAFSETTDYMAPSTREFMLNFAVDDMDAFLARLAAKGVPVIKHENYDGLGRFAWIMDPDGTKIELWEPKR